MVQKEPPIAISRVKGRKIMEDKETIILDEKTKKMIIGIRNQILETKQKMDMILQTVVNVKYPESNDTYELSEDCSKLTLVK